MTRECRPGADLHPGVSPLVALLRDLARCEDQLRHLSSLRSADHLDLNLAAARARVLDQQGAILRQLRQLRQLRREGGLVRAAVTAPVG